MNKRIQGTATGDIASLHDLLCSWKQTSSILSVFYFIHIIFTIYFIMSAISLVTESAGIYSRYLRNCCFHPQPQKTKNPYFGGLRICATGCIVECA